MNESVAAAKTVRACSIRRTWCLYHATLRPSPAVAT